MSAGDGALLLRAIDAAPPARWVELRGRRLQQWGGTPLPGGVLQGAEPLPPFLSALAAALRHHGLQGLQCYPALPPNSLALQVKQRLLLNVPLLIVVLLPLPLVLLLHSARQ